VSQSSLLVYEVGTWSRHNPTSRTVFLYLIGRQNLHISIIQPNWTCMTNDTEWIGPLIVRRHSPHLNTSKGGLQTSAWRGRESASFISRLMTSPATFRSVVIIDERTSRNHRRTHQIRHSSSYWYCIITSTRKWLRKCEWIVVNVTIFDEWLLRFALVPEWRQCIIYVSPTSLYNSCLLQVMVANAT
jgi:hypothetical protein